MELHDGAPEEVRRPEDIAREQSLGGKIPVPVSVLASPPEYQWWDTNQRDVELIDWENLIPESFRNRDRSPTRIYSERQLR